MPSVKIAALVLALTLFSPPGYSSFLMIATLILVAPYSLVWLSGGRRYSVGGVPFKPYRLILIAYILLILTSIFFNGRLFVYQDYAEVLLVAKYAGAFYLFYSASRNYNNFQKLTKVFSVICFIYLSLNIIQIFDYYLGSPFGGFYSLYTPDHHQYATEILRERGEANRFTGLSGNPNSHGAMLLVILLAIICTSTERRIDHLLAMVCIVLILFSQSRTTLIAACATLVFVLIRSKWTVTIFIKMTISLIFLVMIAYFTVISLNLTFVTSIFNQGLTESESLSVRVENWITLLRMIEENPIFGYAPRQEFFALERINADSEYILTAWRYGLIGFMAAMAIFFYPLLQAYRESRKSSRFRLTLVSLTLITLIIGFTNVTLSDSRFSIIYAFVLGVAMGRKDGENDFVRLLGNNRRTM